MSGDGPTTRPGCEVATSLWNEFVDDVESRKGYTRGQLGPELENAIREYIYAAKQEGDTFDMFVRVLDELESQRELLERTQSDDHTRTQTKSMQRAEEIASEARQQDPIALRNDDFEGIIEEVAGGDPRTLKKYKKLIKRHQLAYQHPQNALWHFDIDQFLLSIRNINFVTQQRCDEIEENPRITWPEFAEKNNIPEITIDELAREHGFDPFDFQEKLEDVREETSAETNQRALADGSRE